MTATGLVNDCATPVFVLDAGPETLAGGGKSYTLDFGARVVGDPFPEAPFSLLNDVPAPADSLAGTFDIEASTFMLSGFQGFSGVVAGHFRGGLSAVLPTDALGVFEETIVLEGVSQNIGGYNGALPHVTLTLRGAVVPEPTSVALAAIGMFLVAWRRRRCVSVGAGE